MSAAEMGGLTADDLWALRHADSVDYRTEGSTGESYITARLKCYAGDSRIFTPREQRAFEPDDAFGGAHRMRRVPVTGGAYLSDYGRVPESPTGYSAFVSYVDRAVQATILDSLRVGDVLSFHWVANNSSQAHESVGWARDQAYLLVTPKRGKGRTYLIAVQSGPDNSARMVSRLHPLKRTPWPVVVGGEA